ncbi:MAG: ABC transporter permease [Arachnia propionica]|uniref:ABC transporter permease n=1 Tax=Arachnia propionica TaxID=1750 RepID=UPI00270C2387|nr:ABC transporter permease [Arachnia propionica]
MLRAAWKSLLSRKLRLLMSALSIVLGITFVSGSLMFTHLLGGAYEQIIKSTVGDVNVLVGGSFEMGDNQRPEAVMLEADVVERIRSTPGVARVAGLVSNPSVYPLDRDGRVITLGGAPGIAINFDDIPAMDKVVGMRVIDGATPAADDEVALDPGTLRRSGHAIGDTIRIATPRGGVQEFTVVGTATYGDGSSSGAAYLFFTLTTMQQLALNGADGYTGVWIQAEPGVDRAELADRIQQFLPHGFEAKDGPTVAEEIRSELDVGLGFINTFLLVFAGIALLVAALLILNTFSILVSQRSRELALFRALGAKRSQVRASVLLEAVVIAVIGASLGIVAGYGLAWVILAVMNVVGIDLGSAQPGITWQLVAISYGVALAVTVVAALLPAVRASRTRPVEAMARAADTAPEGIGLPAWFGLGMVQLGAAAVVCGTFFTVPHRLWWVAVGAAVVLVGAVLSAAVLGAPVLWLVGRVNTLIFGEVGRMAARNATRQPRRTAATAATLMIGLTLVSTIAILAATATATLRSTLAEDQRGDFLMTPVNHRPFVVDVERLEQIDGVSAVWTYAQSAVAIGDGDPQGITGTSPEGLTRGTSTTVLAGELLETSGSVLIDHQLSEELDLPMGRRFTVPGVDGSPVELLVTGIIDGRSAPLGISELVTNQETFSRLGDPNTFGVVKVEVAKGADPAAVKQALRDATTDHPLVSVVNNDEFIDDRLTQFNTLLGIIYGLLALAIVISVLGIINTLGLSVLERTREIGLLRAVGLTRPQLRHMVRLEAVAVAVLGAVLGVVLGIGFGTALVRVIPDLEVLDVPWSQLVIFVVVSGFIGVMAAILPARRASRLNVLDSIATQ